MAETTSGGGLGVLAILQIIFIVLKIVDVIDWSWWAVFIPLYIEIALLIIIVLGVIIAEKLNNF